MKINEEEKAMWLEGWKASGKKAWTYARENGLIPQTFCSWVKKAGISSPSGFVEIPQRILPKYEQPQEIRIEKGDIKIYIPLSVCAESLKAVMEGLRVAI